MKDNINHWHFWLFFGSLFAALFTVEGCKQKEKEPQEEVVLMDRNMTAKVIFESGSVDTLHFKIRGTLKVNEMGWLIDDQGEGSFSSDIIARQVTAYSILKEDQTP
jgi:hypothetical protein